MQASFPNWIEHYHILLFVELSLASEPIQEDYIDVREGHSTFAPENLMTLAHLSVSSATSLPNSAGVIGIGVLPRAASRALVCGSLRPLLILLFRLLMK